MEEIDVFKSMREAVDGELSPFADEKEVARLKIDRLSQSLAQEDQKTSPYQFLM